MGANWYDKTIPTEIKNGVKRKNNNLDYKCGDILYYVDFKEIRDFLFIPYERLTKEEKKELINRYLERKLTCIDDLEKFLPKTNWELYFCNLLENKQNLFDVKWKKLSKIRNAIAHNRVIVKDEIKDLESIYTQINSILHKIDNSIESYDYSSYFIERKKSNGKRGK
ncbi:MAG: hypothetical protein ACNI25_07505 [Halarcobacter sp.]